MSYPRSFSCLVLAVVLSACSTLEEIRQSEPVRTSALKANYKDIAACVAHEIAGRFRVSNTVLEREGRAVITYINDIQAGFLQGREPVWELTIRNSDSMPGSRAEFRSMRTLIGTSPWADEVWPAVEGCDRS